MWQIALFGVGTIIGVLAFIGGLLALRAYIPAPTPTQDTTAAHRRLDDLEVVFESFRAQYELENNRSSAKLRKLRRQLARERGEDVDDDPVTEPLADRAGEGPVLETKAQLRTRAFSEVA